MTEIKKNEIVEVAIESLAFGGKAVAHVNGFTIFIKGALPGQKAKVRITRKKENYAEARVLEVLTPSPYEVSPRCSYFAYCGGCSLQNLDYQEQLAQKQRQVEETMKHIGGFTEINLLPIIPATEIFFYRNKMEFSFSNKRWLMPEEMESGEAENTDFALGLHVPRSYDKVLDIKECFLLSEQSNRIVNFIGDFARQSQLAPYTTKGHSGFWRFVVIRESKQLHQVMINMVTADHPKGGHVIQELTQQLREKFPFITTVIHNINRKKAQIAFGDEEQIMYGPGFIEEVLGTKKYRISANSFFQTNTSQAEKMYHIIADWAQLARDQIVYDLYSGTGSIAIFIADKVKKVIGSELVPQAIQDAKLNCQLNHIENCEFIQGDLKEVMQNPEELVQNYGRPHTVIIDPPRSGMHPKLPAKILQLKPERIVYVSCNPATLARDLKELCQSDFKLTQIQPIDMFPHTVHCETVALLDRV